MNPIRGASSPFSTSLHSANLQSTLSTAAAAESGTAPSERFAEPSPSPSDRDFSPLAPALAVGGPSHPHAQPSSAGEGRLSAPLQQRHNAPPSVQALEPDAPAWLRSPKLHLRLLSRPGVVLVVAMRHVSQLPNVSLHECDPCSLTLCPAFDTAALVHEKLAGGESNDPICPAGTDCCFVHADVRRAAEYRPHELAQADASPRFTASDVFGPHAPGAPAASQSVLAASSTIAVLRPPPPPSGRRGAGARAPPAPPTLVHVAIGDLLRTRAFNNTGVPPAADGAKPVVTPPALCVHFEGKGRCDRGDACNYVHHAPPGGRQHDPPLVTFYPPPELATRRGDLTCSECAAVGSCGMKSAEVLSDRVQHTACPAARRAAAFATSASAATAAAAAAAAAAVPSRSSATPELPPARQHRPYDAEPASERFGPV